jgi:hypothetical protein
MKLSRKAQCWTKPVCTQCTLQEFIIREGPSSVCSARHGQRRRLQLCGFGSGHGPRGRGDVDLIHRIEYYYYYYKFRYIWCSCCEMYSKTLIETHTAMSSSWSFRPIIIPQQKYKMSQCSWLESREDVLTLDFVFFL